MNAAGDFRKVEAMPEGDLLTIRELVAQSGISRQAVQTRMRRHAVPTTKVVRDGRVCILVRRADAEAAGLTLPRSMVAAGEAPAGGLVEAFAEEREKVDRLSKEVGRLAAELIAKDELREQGDWLRKATERRCDKLEAKLEDRDRELADQRRTILLRDGELAQLRQSIALLTSRQAVPMLASGDSSGRRGWFDRLFRRRS